MHYFFTRFKFGFLALAAGEAFLVALARIAPALFLLTPSFLDIEAATALKPGCAFFAMINQRLRK